MALHHLVLAVSALGMSDVKIQESGRGEEKIVTHPPQRKSFYNKHTHHYTAHARARAQIQQARRDNKIRRAMNKMAAKRMRKHGVR